MRKWMFFHSDCCQAFERVAVAVADLMGSLDAVMSMEEGI